MVLNVAGAPAGAPAHLRALGAPRAYFNRLSLHGSARHLAALRPRILTAVDTTTAGTSTTAKEREGDPGAPGHANHEHGRPRVGKADKIPSPPNGKAAQALFQSALNSLDLIEATPQHASDEEYEVIVEEVLSAVSVEPGAAAQAYGQANFEVTQVDEVGRVRSMFVKRRDLLREHNLQPRDLRRIDPSLELSKASPSLTIKDNCLLINMGGIRAIVTAHRALLFEPRSGTSQKFLQLLVAKLTSQERQRALRRFGMLGGPGLKSPGGGGGGADPETFSHQEYMERYYSNDAEDQLPPPFELEVLEGALTVASSRMDAELLAVSRRCTTLLTKLPRYITPVNLEELRRIKSALVELEDKADSLRELFEELMDDEEELIDLNLSSRPRRELRRKQRERSNAERMLDRAREANEEWQQQAAAAAQRLGGSGAASSSSSLGGGGSSALGAAPRRAGGVTFVSSRRMSGSGTTGGRVGMGSGAARRVTPSRERREQRMQELRAKFQVQSAAELRLKLDQSKAPGRAPPPPLTTGVPAAPPPPIAPSPLLPGGDGGYGPLDGPAVSSSSSSSSSSAVDQLQPQQQPSIYDVPESTGSYNGGGEPLLFDGAPALVANGGGGGGGGGGAVADGDGASVWPPSALEGELTDTEGDWFRRGGGDVLSAADANPDEDVLQAQATLEELVEQEEEEREIEEVEDLLEYYLQRASAIQSEAERLLTGTRDLEESISVSLSAKRFELTRLELTLSVGSFASAVGALIAGIFGMNLKSTLEFSVSAFWGITAAILLGSAFICWAIIFYIKRRKIL